ncbi:hypothetical protein SAMN04488574_1241, partial [Bacillus sp. 71mf]
PIGLLRAVYLPPNFLRKAEVARSECEGDGASDVEGVFYLVGRSEATEHSSHWSWTMLLSES